VTNYHHLPDKLGKIGDFLNIKKSGGYKPPQSSTRNN
jgi:hypothetical protein